MKKFFKENKILIIVYIIMFVLIGFGVYEYQKDHGYKKRVEYHERILKQCEDYDYRTKTEDEQEFMKGVCERTQSEEVKMDDTITTFFDLLDTKSLSYFYKLIPLFIIVCSLSRLSRTKKSLKCYKQALVFLGFILLIFGISFIISGHFDYRLALNYEDNNFYTTMPYSILVFFLILALNYVFYINLSLIVAKYSKNIYFSIFITSIIWLVLVLFIYVIVGALLFGFYFNLSLSESFSLLDIYSMIEFESLLGQLGVSLILAIGSFTVFYLSYRKKV